MVNCVLCTVHPVCEGGHEPLLRRRGVAHNATDSRVLLTYLGHPMGMSGVTSRDISE